MVGELGRKNNQNTAFFISKRGEKNKKRGEILKTTPLLKILTPKI